MRYWWQAIIPVFFLLFAVAAHAAAGNPLVQRQQIAVTLAPERHLLVGESVITYAPGTRRVTLRLSRQSSVDSVKAAGKSVPFSFAGSELSLALPDSSEPVAVRISYHGTFHDQVSRNPAAGEDPSYGVNGTITTEGTFLGDGALWYPVPSQVPARRSISIEAPAMTEAITFGRRVSRETSGVVTRSSWEEARPVGALSLCAGPYRIEERVVNGIHLYSYLYPDNASLSGRYLDAAAKYLAFYSDLFGPYPFEKFAVVENFFQTGYGFPSFTLLGGAVIRLPFIIDTSFPHEIAHSWWGNGIEPDLREGNWSEGLVTYLADYYLKERRSPAEAAEYRRQLLVDFASLVSADNDFPLKDFVSRNDPASRAIGYGKGAMVFHMVRSRIGDRAFFDALRAVCRERMYGTANWSDFIRAFSRGAGQDLSPFMLQWLTRTGGPRLSLANVNSQRREGKWEVSGAIVQTGPSFEVGVPLRLQAAGDPVKVVLPVAGERTPFRIASAKAPSRLLLDPDADIFRILSPGEIPAAVNSIKGSGNLVGVITANCRAERKTFQNLLASLSQSQTPVIDEREVGPREGAAHDLLFCGMPQDHALLPMLPEGIDLSGSGFAMGGVTFAAPDALLFLVMQQSGSGRVVGLYQPLSEAAAAQYGPKITHYGKYGFLVFADGGNRRKGTAAATDRAVSVDLR